MPKASAPNAPCVAVWLSPQTTVMPGWVRPSSGPITCTMPRVGAVPAMQRRCRERGSCAPAFRPGGARLRLHIGPRAVRRGGQGRGGMVERGERAVGTAHLQAARIEFGEGLGRGHLVHEMQVDVEHGGTSLRPRARPHARPRPCRTGSYSAARARSATGSATGSSQPYVVRGRAVEQAVECLQQPPRHRRPDPRTRRDIVNRTDRRDLRRRSGQEDLVGEVERLARQDLLDHLDAFVAAPGVSTVSRVMPTRIDDAAGGVSSRPSLTRNRFSPAPSDRRPSVPSADAFDVAAALGLAADQIAREVVAAGLGAHGHGVGRRARPAGHADVDAEFQSLVAEVGAPRKCRDRDVHVHVFVGGHDAHAAFAEEGDRAQIGVGQDRWRAPPPCTPRRSHRS